MPGLNTLFQGRKPGFARHYAPQSGTTCSLIVQLLLWGYLPHAFHRKQRPGDIHHALILVHRHFAQRCPGLLLTHILVGHQHAFCFINGFSLLKRIAQRRKLTGELLNLARLLANQRQQGLSG